MTQHYSITVKDRKENIICTFKDDIASNTTVQDFKLLFVK